jgi:hypothetical protein
LIDKHGRIFAPNRSAQIIDKGRHLFRVFAITGKQYKSQRIDVGKKCTFFIK